MKHTICRILRFAEAILPTLFWIALLFGTEGTAGAWMTLLAALIHEGGHLAVLCLPGGKRPSLRASVSGLRILPARRLSYREDLLLAAAGPGANLLFAALLSLPPFSDLALLRSVNLFTALSNLLPIRGYDGFRILSDGLLMLSPLPCDKLLSAVSTGFTVVLLFLALYTVNRLGIGVWIFFLLLSLLIQNLDRGSKATFFEDSRDF